jgi:hypothetical protein
MASRVKFSLSPRGILNVFELAAIKNLSPVLVDRKRIYFGNLPDMNVVGGQSKCNL